MNLIVVFDDSIIDITCVKANLRAVLFPVFVDCGANRGSRLRIDRRIIRRCRTRCSWRSQQARHTHRNQYEQGEKYEHGAHAVDDEIKSANE